MARTHGRAPRGQRLRVGVPHGHWETTTVVAALTLRGMIAPFVLSGPINREAFEAYLERVLVPELRPGDVVAMDTLSSHKGPKVRALIEAAGARLLFLRPAARTSTRSKMPSPGSRRSFARQPEPTVAGLWSATGRIVDLFNPAECANYLAGRLLRCRLMGDHSSGLRLT